MNIGIYSGFWMLSESSFIESGIFQFGSGFSVVESGFLKRESEHESGFFPSPGFLWVRVRSGFRSMPIALAKLSYFNALCFSTPCTIFRQLITVTLQLKYYILTICTNVRCIIPYFNGNTVLRVWILLRVNPPPPPPQLLHGFRLFVRMVLNTSFGFCYEDEEHDV